MLANIRRPGLAPDDLDTARRLVLARARAGDGRWLSPTVAQLASYLWSVGWEDELRRLLLYHSPNRAGAKRLLARSEQARKRRPGP